MSFRDFLVGLEAGAGADHDSVPDDLFDELASLIHESQHNNSASNNPSNVVHVASGKSGEGACVLASATCAASGSASEAPASAHHILSSMMPKELLGSMVCDALDCFMFLVTGEGRIKLISEGVSEILGVRQRDMTGVSLYDLIHAGDHARFSLCLMLADSDAAKSEESRVFNCRFRSRRLNDAIVYETMQVSALPMRHSHNNNNSNLSQCRLFCLARRISPRERNQYFPVEPFTTKLDPAANFVVTAVDTTGMNGQIVAEFLQASLIHKPIVQAIHADDRAVFQRHLQSCIREGEHVSSVVRMQANKDEFVHVQTKSKLFKACPQMGTQRAFIMATHSVIGQTEVMPSNNNNNNNDSKTLTLESKAGASEIGSGQRLSEIQSAESEAREKNILLKQLLNITSSSRSDLSSSSSQNVSQVNNNNVRTSVTTSTSNRILQLLSRADHNVQRSSQIKGVKRSSSGSTNSPVSPKQACLSPRSSENSSPSVDASNVCQQNPSLTSLLSKPSNSAIAAVPPPVPTKWHQEPREKLPKSEDNLKKFLPPHPAERGRLSLSSLDHVPSPPSMTLATTAVKTSTRTARAGTTAQPSMAGTTCHVSHARTRALSSPAAASVFNTSSPHSQANSSSSGHVCEALGVTDTELNDILEGVIDIQERSLASSGLTTSTAKARELSEIERYLASSETANELQNLSSPIIQSEAGGKRGVLSVASNATHQQPIGQRNATNLSPVSLVPRINELLQEVPPNVSVPQQTPELSLVLMQQQQQQRRRHMSSGTSTSSSLLPSNAQQQDLTLRLQQQQHQHRLTHSQSLPNNQLSHILPHTTVNKQRNAAPPFASQGFRQTRMSLRPQHVPQSRVQLSVTTSVEVVRAPPLLQSMSSPVLPGSSLHLLPLNNAHSEPPLHQKQQQQPQQKQQQRPQQQQQKQQQRPQQQDSAQGSRSLLQKLLSD